MAYKEREGSSTNVEQRSNVVVDDVSGVSKVDVATRMQMKIQQRRAMGSTK